MNQITVKQIRTGKVKELGEVDAKNPMERPWRSGMFKQEQEGKIWLYETGLAADEVADTRVHGGPEKALFAYPAIHYDYWQKTLPDTGIDIGAMGENMVIEGTDECTTCIGDVYRFGETMIEVSQPRQPCWKPARRFQVLDFALQIQQSGYTGWYYRVKKEGYVMAEELELVDRPYPQWTIAACNEVMHIDKANLSRAYELASCPALAGNWQKRLQKRLRGQESSIGKRVYGPNKQN